jgi:hypothetical protein
MSSIDKEEKYQIRIKTRKNELKATFNKSNQNPVKKQIKDRKKSLRYIKQSPHIII